MLTLAGALDRKALYCRADNLLRILTILFQICDDVRHGNGVVLWMPAIIVGDETDRRIADLGFAGEFRFLKVGHSNEVHSPAPIDIGFRPRRELRSFHADVRAASFDSNVGVLSRPLDDAGEQAANRIRETDMRDEAIAEERRDTSPGPIVKLIGQNDIQRLQLFFERTDSACRKNPLRAQLFESVDIRAELSSEGEIV